MSQLFIPRIHIDEVRHLRDTDIAIPSEGAGLRNIIFTSKNGSGKTN